MSTKEILNNLNKFSKKYIDDFLSFYSFFTENNSLNDDTIIFSSLFLSMLKNDEISSRFFYKYGITYDNYKNIFKDLDFDKMNFIKSEESKYLPNINLKALFLRILIKVTYTCYLENEILPYEKITNFQIFDTLIEDYQEELFHLLRKNYNLNYLYSNIFEEYNNYIYDYYNDFAQFYYGINIEEEATKELNSFKVLNYEECDIEFNSNESYITFKENADLDKIIFFVNKDFETNDKAQERKNKFISSISLPASFVIERIGNIHEINSDSFKSVLNDKKNKKMSMEIRDLTNNKTNVIWIDKYYTFTSEKQRIIDRILNEEDDDKVININEKDDTKLYTPYLDKYGFDLTKDNYIKDPSIGRDDEIRRIEQILCYPERDKSIIITGVAGSGKTALAKGLAYRVQKGDVPSALKNLRIISIDSATLVAGTKYVGTLEEKMKNILEEASSSKDIIIFMDEIHQALGAGKAEGDPNSVSEILKPYLDYGRVRIIGATTTEEYNEFVSKDDAFKTRFKRINISEPDDHIVYEVLDDLIESYNHLSEKSNFSCPKLNLNIEERDMIIKWLIDSTRPNFRSYNDRASNPRLVLDIIKEAYAIASLNNQDEVTMLNLKEAILLEERLYLSSRKRQVQRLDEIKPSYKKDNVIPFNLILKK